ncbi:amidase [Shigella sonnei]|nr:amidase [Shigella sonnei]
MLGGADNPNGELPSYITGADTSEMPALIMAEVTPERVRQVRAQLPVLNNRRFAPPQLL